MSITWNKRQCIARVFDPAPYLQVPYLQVQGKIESPFSKHNSSTSFARLSYHLAQVSTIARQVVTCRTQVKFRPQVSIEWKINLLRVTSPYFVHFYITW